MKKLEIGLAFFSIVSITLNTLMIGFPNAITIIAFMSTSMFYFGGSIFLISGFSKKHKENRMNLNGVSIPLIIGFGFCISSLIVGLLYSFQFWPFADELVFLGLVGLIGICVWMYMVRARIKKLVVRNMMIRIPIFLILALCYIIMPKYSIIEFKYRNHPVYLEALKNSRNNPNDIELWEKAKDERRKMRNQED